MSGMRISRPMTGRTDWSAVLPAAVTSNAAKTSAKWFRGRDGVRSGGVGIVTRPC
jgi:hypothetical protein